MKNKDKYDTIESAQSDFIELCNRICGVVMVVSWILYLATR